MEIVQNFCLFPEVIYYLMMSNTAVITINIPVDSQFTANYSTDKGQNSKTFSRAIPDLHIRECHSSQISCLDLWCNTRARFHHCLDSCNSSPPGPLEEIFQAKSCRGWKRITLTIF